MQVSDPQFIVIHTVKGFGIVNKTEIDVFMDLSCFSMIQRNIKWQKYSRETKLLQIEHMSLSPFPHKIMLHC